MLTIADCRRRVQIEICLGTKTARRVSLKKINLLIEVLTRFRDTLIQENELIGKFEQGKTRKRSKADGNHYRESDRLVSGFAGGIEIGIEDQDLIVIINVKAHVFEGGPAFR